MKIPLKTSKKASTNACNKNNMKIKQANKNHKLQLHATKDTNNAKPYWFKSFGIKSHKRTRDKIKTF